MTSIAHQLQQFAKTWINTTAQRADSESALDRYKLTASLKLLTRYVGKAIPFATRNGFEVIDYRPGYIKTRIPLKPNKNHFNAMYAGALFTVAELPGGILSLLNFDEQFYPILTEMTMRYLKPAQSDVTVEFHLTQETLDRIHSEARAQGKSLFSLEGEIKDRDGQIVATSTAHYQVRQR